MAFRLSVSCPPFRGDLLVRLGASFRPGLHHRGAAGGSSLTGASPAACWSPPDSPAGGANAGGLSAHCFSYSTGARSAGAGMPAPRIIEAFDELEDGVARPARAGKRRRSSSSHSSVAKKLSLQWRCRRRRPPIPWRGARRPRHRMAPLFPLKAGDAEASPGSGCRNRWRYTAIPDRNGG
jgi:hypothetical protein